MKKAGYKIIHHRYYNHIKMLIDKDWRNRHQEVKSDGLWVVDQQVIIFLLFSVV